MQFNRHAIPPSYPNASHQSLAFSQSFQRLTSNGSPEGLNDDGTVRRQMAQELLPRVDAVINGDTVGSLPVDTFRVLSYSPNQCGHCMCVLAATTWIHACHTMGC